MPKPIDDEDAKLKKAYEDLKSSLGAFAESEGKDLKETTDKWAKELKRELANQMDQLTAKINSQLKMK